MRSVNLAHIRSFLWLSAALVSVAQQSIFQCGNYSNPDDDSEWTAAVLVQGDDRQVWISSNFIYEFTLTSNPGCSLQLVETFVSTNPIPIPQGFQFMVVSVQGNMDFPPFTLVGILEQDPTTIVKVNPQTNPWQVLARKTLQVPKNTVWCKIDPMNDESIPIAFFLFSGGYLVSFSMDLTIISFVDLSSAIPHRNIALVGCTGGAYVRNQFNVFVMRSGPTPDDPAQIVDFKTGLGGSIETNTAIESYLGSAAQMTCAVPVNNGNNIAIVWGQETGSDLGTVFSWAISSNSQYFADVKFAPQENFTSVYSVMGGLGDFLVASSSGVGYTLRPFKSSTTGVVSYPTISEPFGSPADVLLAVNWGGYGNVGTVGASIDGVAQVIIYKWKWTAEGSREEINPSAGPKETESSAEIGVHFAALGGCMPSCACTGPVGKQVCGPTLPCSPSSSYCEQDEKQREWDCCP